jgi:hypothetical protein
LLMIGVANVHFSQAPNSGLNVGGNSTPTPYPTYPTYPDVTPAPTVDPNAFAITQRVDEEYIFGYTVPTANIRGVIVDPDWTGYEHSISVIGTYENWRYDVYVKLEFGSTWVYSTSGATDESGFGSAYIPLFASMGGHSYQTVALIDPNGGGAASDLLGGDLSELELISMINAGTIRSSNTLQFDVIASAVL